MNQRNAAMLRATFGVVLFFAHPFLGLCIMAIAASSKPRNPSLRTRSARPGAGIIAPDD